MRNPLAVDLDGTLIRTDLLFELTILYIKSRPFSVFMLVMWLIRGGKANLKRRLTQIVGEKINVSNLPYDAEVTNWITSQRNERDIYLVSAADEALVHRVANHLGLFEGSFGSDGRTNLSSSSKAAFLKNKFGDHFDYIGNSKDDLKVWEKSNNCYSANATAGLLKTCARRGLSVEVVAGRKSSIKAALRALRPHQWTKNAFVFVPVALDLLNLSILALGISVVTFICLSMSASAGYLFNDLLDIESDRSHSTKKERPFASGELPIMSGLLLIIALPLVALGATLLIAGWQTALGIGAYLLATISYSIWLKRIAIVDTLFLAFLFCLRVLIGGLAIQVYPSAWFVVFLILFFLSMALGKRYIELRRSTNGDNIPGRGYRAEDTPAIFAFGFTSGFSAIVVFLIYAMMDRSSLVTSHVTGLVIAGLLGFWTMRIWLLMQRGAVDDDPVYYAIKDTTSITIAATVIVSVIFDQLYHHIHQA